MKSDKKFNKIISDIKFVKIQSAENVCKAGIKAYLISPTKTSAKKIIKARPTEPLLQNAIKFLQKSPDKKSEAKKFLKDLRESHKKITIAGEKLIKNNMNIYSHCHSSTVIDILKYAKKKGKKFTVYTSEVEPLLQGRKTAKDLARAGIDVVVSPDLAIGESIKKCDIFFFGSDAYTKDFTYNKIGTSVINRLAKERDTKTYSCGVSMKFTKKVEIENRSESEVWDNKIKKIKIENPAFDKTKMTDITGIISEFGILSPKQFTKKAKDKLKNF